ncbi:MAG TPA: hypothetical protein HPQ04_02110 [Rhodospirillaceae bacterium]|nr:hypothetical protein [Rhodospirillaceae bacterium]
MRLAAILWLAGGLVQPALAQGQSAQSWRDELLQGCWACDALEQTSGIALQLADQAFSTLSGELTTLVGILMGLWLLFFAARMVMPFGPEGNVAGQWNKAAKKLLLLVVVLGFLQNSRSFWDYVFIPLMSAGFGIAGQIIQISDPFEAQLGGASETLPQVEDKCSRPQGGSGLVGAQQVMQQMACPLAKLQSQFGKGILIGEAIIVGGNISTAYILPNIDVVKRVISGVALVCIYFCGFILYPLLFIDVVMRVAVIAVISPLAVAASLFVPTRGLAVKALWHLAQSALTLVFASVVGGISKAVLANTFSRLPTADGQALKDWASLLNALQNPGTSGVEIDFTTSSFYVLAGVGILLLFMLRKARFMASEFTHVDGADFSGAQTAVAGIAGAAAYVGGNAVQILVQKVTHRKTEQN